MFSSTGAMETHLRAVSVSDSDNTVCKENADWLKKIGL